MALVAMVVSLSIWLSTVLVLRRSGKGAVLRHAAGLIAGSAALLTSALVLVAEAPQPKETVSNNDALPDPVSEKTQTSSSATLSSMRVGAIALQYEKDPVAASRLFNNRKLMVTGIVQGVDRDEAGDIVVRLIATNPYLPAFVHFADGYQTNAALIQSGQRVTFDCINKGLNTGSVIFEKCMPVQL